MERILIVPDTHRPYHDVRAWNVLLEAGDLFKPDRIIVLGDFWDGYCISQHRKDPNRNRHLEVEVASVNEGLDQLDALGAGKKHYLQGNHEESLERYLMDRAPELFNMVRVEKLFKLRDRGWQYTPYRQMVRIGKVHYTHDLGACGAHAHEAAERDVQGSIVIGHTHRAAIAYTGNATGARHVAMMSGWLGDPKAAEYLHRAKATRFWQHGFTIGHMERSGVTHLQFIPIINGRACVDGKLVKA
jgi:predicted phosphodiesterase